MQVQWDLRQKGLPGPPERILSQVSYGKAMGREGWVPEPRAVRRTNEAKVRIMRVPGQWLPAALQSDPPLLPAPPAPPASDEAARGGEGAAGGDKAAGSQAGQEGHGGPRRPTWRRAAAPEARDLGSLGRGGGSLGRGGMSEVAGRAPGDPDGT